MKRFQPWELPRKVIVSPDGPVFIVDLERVRVGASFFIPAIDLKGLREEVLAITRQGGYRYKAAEVIEKGMLGVRFWRIA